MILGRIIALAVCCYIWGAVVGLSLSLSLLSLIHI